MLTHAGQKGFRMPKFEELEIMHVSLQRYVENPSHIVLNKIKGLFVERALLGSRQS